MNVLVINCGSSSLKYQLIDSEKEQVLAKGLCERIGIDGSAITHQKAGGEKQTQLVPMDFSLLNFLSLICRLSALKSDLFTHKLAEANLCVKRNALTSYPFYLQLTLSLMDCREKKCYSQNVTEPGCFSVADHLA